MKQTIKTYLYFFISTFVLLIISCRSAKPFSCEFQNPLDYAYNSYKLKDTIEVNSIRNYRLYIDSFIDNDRNQINIVRSISEGIINKRFSRASKIGRKNKIKSAGFGKYTYENQKGDTIYKILYHDNLDKNFYESFYFKDNKLICAIIKYEENGIGSVFYSRQEYYDNGETIFVEESRNNIEEIYRQRVAFDLKKKGADYLKWYYDERN